MAHLLNCLDFIFRQQSLHQSSKQKHYYPLLNTVTAVNRKHISHILRVVLSTLQYCWSVSTVTQTHLIPCVCQSPVHADPNPLKDQQIFCSILRATLFGHTSFLEMWLHRGWKPRVLLNDLTRLALHEYQTWLCGELGRVVNPQPLSKNKNRASACCVHVAGGKRNYLTAWCLLESIYGFKLCRIFLFMKDQK